MRTRSPRLMRFGATGFGATQFGAMVSIKCSFGARKTGLRVFLIFYQYNAEWGPWIKNGLHFLPTNTLPMIKDLKLHMSDMGIVYVLQYWHWI